MANLNNEGFNLEQANKEYPYGKFPIEYTKYGKQELKKIFEEKERQASIQAIQSNNDQPNKDNNVIQSNNNMNGLLGNNMDLKMLLPLLKGMGGKDKLNQDDMFKMMLPLLGGNKQMLDIFSTLSSVFKKTTSTTSLIDRYNAIDQTENSETSTNT